MTVARMPRGIGASTGVNDSVRAPGALLDLRGVLVAADLVAGQVAHDLTAEQVRLGVRPAPVVPEAATTTTSSGLTSSESISGASARIVATA